MSGERVLIIAPAWIGDMVMAQVLFKLLKNQDKIIDVAAPIWSHALLARMPEVNQTFTIEINHGELALKKRWRLAQLIKKNQYNQAIILPNSCKSALIPFFAAIPRRTGWLGEFRYGLLNDIRKLDKIKLPLMIQRFAALGLEKNIALPDNLPYPELQISTDSLKSAITKYNLDPTSKKIIALCPGAEYGSAKRWPQEYFARVAQEKIKAGMQVWLFGSSKEQGIGEFIQQENNSCVNLMGKTTLAEAIDLLSLASLVISNDSGLMHIAAALNIPLVALYGSSSPTFTPPLIAANKLKILNKKLACSPCYDRHCKFHHLNCLTTLSSEEVLAASNELMLGREVDLINLRS